eukprot:m.16336 g.16336  ORF g.16336 m.16336 type:complete len:490 (+) comp26866_c0_seq1:420-1889(+)
MFRKRSLDSVASPHQPKRSSPALMPDFMSSNNQRNLLKPPSLKRIDERTPRRLSLDAICGNSSSANGAAILVNRQNGVEKWNEGLRNGVGEGVIVDRRVLGGGKATFKPTATAKSTQTPPDWAIVDAEVLRKTVEKRVKKCLQDETETYAKLFSDLVSENRKLREKMESMREKRRVPPSPVTNVGVDATLPVPVAASSETSVMQPGHILPSSSSVITLANDVNQPTVPSLSPLPPSLPLGQVSAPMMAVLNATECPLSVHVPLTHAKVEVQMPPGPGSLSSVTDTVLSPTNTIHYQNAHAAQFPSQQNSYLLQPPSTAVQTIMSPSSHRNHHQAQPLSHHGMVQVNQSQSQRRQQQQAQQQPQWQQQQQQQHGPASLHQLKWSFIPVPLVSAAVFNSGIILKWHLKNEDICKCSMIAKYELFSSYGHPATQRPQYSSWNQIGSVRALALPMQCTLTQFVKGRRYILAIRALDIHGNAGALSRECFVDLP